MKNKHPVLRRFMRRKVSVVAAAVLILFVLIAILGPLVWQVDPLKQSVMKKYGPMTVQHPLGTDNLGRDTLARMIYGARVSLAISFAGVLSGALIGVLLGVSAGYFGGWVDAIISRFIDILLAFPGLLLAITIVAVLGPGSVNTVIAITIFTIPGLTRMVRSVVLSLKSSEYVEACKTMGESNLRIIFTHVMSVIRYISDRVGVMYLGHLVEEGDTDEVFDHPQHPYTRTLMSAVPSIDPRDNRQRILLEGDLPSPIDPPSGCVFHTRCPWATEACKTASCELREVRKGHYAACSRGEQE